MAYLYTIQQQRSGWQNIRKMGTTIKEAQEVIVFYTENGSVIESSLYNYLNEYGQGDDTSAVEEKEVTTYTVDGCSFDSESGAEDHCDENEIEYSEIVEKTETHYSHVVRYHANYGRKIKGSESFETDQEAAEMAYIKGLEWYVSEKNWDAPEYFNSHEEAEAMRLERAAEAMGVDVDVLESIERKEKIVSAARKTWSEKIDAIRQAEEQVIFDKYCNLVSKIEGENYKATAARFGAALDHKMQSNVFHKIVKFIRSK